MKPYIEWTKEELVAEKARLEQEFAEVKAKGLNLNISRGKPAAAQLDLTEGMLTVLSKNEDTFAEDGTDCRNYGVLTGIPEARKLIGDICEVPAENVIVYGNASQSQFVACSGKRPVCLKLNGFRRKVRSL